ncbi:Hypothetical predicted protein [Mytilus galloprovincialis]|uniref:Uncharacterized protein n=1 Tax=Mytilus galloprovincialis TaxID=29158 RepID=A0A8B6CSS7_MYTGA|nr:Hypothetical predicted protein [Mytilus galloprovincialis]
MQYRLGTSSDANNNIVASAENSQKNSQISNWSDCSELGLVKVKVVKESINVSPLRSILQNDVKDSTIRYSKREAHESIDSLLDFMAPKQGHLLLKDEVLTKNRDKYLPTDSDMIEDLSTLYMETVDNFLKMQILSVITSRLTKAEQYIV